MEKNNNQTMQYAFLEPYLTSLQVVDFESPVIGSKE